MDDEKTLPYRRALSTLPTGVVLVTVSEARGDFGLVCNSFTSVSLEPPLILWCLGDRSDRGAYFRHAEHFAINILTAEDERIARRYVERGRHRLELEDYALGGPTQLPCVRAAAATLFCRTHKRFHLADHVVVVGEVEDWTAADSPAEGLTYFRRRFGSAAIPE